MEGRDGRDGGGLNDAGASPQAARRTPTSPQLAALLRALGHDDSAVEDLWLDHQGLRLHCDLQRAAAARAVVVFHPGSGSYARFYCGLGQRLAARGLHWIGIDRPGHGWSEGARGDGTIEQSLAITERVIAHARESFGLPVVLMGSSLGGLLVGFAVIAGQKPDAAIAHNFLIPGRLASMRLRAWAIERWRRRPYLLHELVHGLGRLSREPAVQAYIDAADDPQAAWSLTPRLVASLFGHDPTRPSAAAAPLVVISGDADRAIPGWASRWFLRWSGLRDASYVALPGAGHLLFHDHLDAAVDLVVGRIDERLWTA